MEQSVLNTKKIRELVDAGNVRTLRADWGTQDEDIGALMDQLQGSRQIPLLAVFPAERPNNPVILKTFYTQAKLAATLRDAGGSKLAAQPRDAGRPAILSQLP